MKLRPIQFGVLENTASPRPHDSRLAVNSLPSPSDTVQRSPHHHEPTPPSASRTNVQASSFVTKPLDAATGKEEGRRVDRNLDNEGHKEPTRKPPVFEPLLGSEAAARLLGNIHVKTLQRYARQGSVPGYRIGGHWYFRTTELDEWLQSRINSNRQSVR
jgi:excisionase family DNA binding protein